MLHPHRLWEIDKDIEAAVLSLLAAIVKEQQDYKRLIGKAFFRDVFRERLRAVREYRYLKGKIAMGLHKTSEEVKKKLQNSKDYNESIEFDDKTEIKFFALVNILCKGSSDNESDIQRYKTEIKDYARDVETLIQEGEAQSKQNKDWPERKAHLDTVRNKLRTLQKLINN